MTQHHTYRQFEIGRLVLQEFLFHRLLAQEQDQQRIRRILQIVLMNNIAINRLHQYTFLVGIGSPSNGHGINLSYKASADKDAAFLTSSAIIISPVDAP